VGEDARKGRIYLPINELQQFNDGRRPAERPPQRKL
jgi:phytoene/squalene synthetase